MGKSHYPEVGSSIVLSQRRTDPHLRCQCVNMDSDALCICLLVQRMEWQKRHWRVKPPAHACCYSYVMITSYRWWVLFMPKPYFNFSPLFYDLWGHLGSKNTAPIYNTISMENELWKNAVLNKAHISQKIAPVWFKEAWHCVQRGPLEPVLAWAEHTGRILPLDLLAETKPKAIL